MQKDKKRNLINYHKRILLHFKLLMVIIKL